MAQIKLFHCAAVAKMAHPTCISITIAILGVSHLLSLNRVEGRPVEDEDPPIDPEFLTDISESLTPEECLKVYGFLVVRNSASQLHKLINWNSTAGYVNYIEMAHQQMKSIQGSGFDCENSLDFWNDRLVGEFTKDMIDRRDFAETLLRVSLNFANRSDLGQSVHNFTMNRHNKDLTRLTTELGSHSQSLVFYGGSNKWPVDNSKALKTSAAVSIFIAFGIMGFVFIIVLCVVIAMRSAQPDYSKINSSNYQDFQEQHKQGNGKFGNSLSNREDTKLLLSNYVV